MTLEDIYRQIKDRDTNEKTEDLAAAADSGPEFEGEVTGYAVPVNHGPERFKDQKISQGFSSYAPSGGSGYGYGQGGKCYSYTLNKYNLIYYSVVFKE